MVNMDPYGEGWMIRVAIHDMDEVENLLTPQDYLVYVTGEEME
jgi:glycine cleavage system H lipoate-binding protein